jgi:hypothetical protein
MRAIVLHKSGLWTWSTKPSLYSSDEYLGEFKWIRMAFGNPPFTMEEYKVGRESILKQWRKNKEGQMLAVQTEFTLSVDGPFSDNHYPIHGMTNELLVKSHRQAIAGNPNTFVVGKHITIYRDWNKMEEFINMTTVKQCIPVLKRILTDASVYLTSETEDSVVESDKSTLLHNWIDVINIISASFISESSDMCNTEFYQESISNIWRDTVHTFIGQKYIQLI